MSVSDEMNAFHRSVRHLTGNLEICHPSVTPTSGEDTAIPAPSHSYISVVYFIHARARSPRVSMTFEAVF